jgi:hypothetical protein
MDAYSRNLLLEVKENVMPRPRNPLPRARNTLLGMRKKPVAEVLAANLKALMQSKPNLSSGPKLERASGISQKTISNMTAGRYSTTIGSIEGVAKALDVPPYVLLLPGADQNVLEIVRAYSQTDDRGRELLLSAAAAVKSEKNGRVDKTGEVDG